MDTPTEKNVKPVEGKKPATPKPGMKTTRRLDTMEVIEQETMTLAELQQDLPFSGSGKVVSLEQARISTEPRRTSRGGVVACDADGEDLHDDDENKNGRD